jgi:hypothetical protein
MDVLARAAGLIGAGAAPAGLIGADAAPAGLESLR